MTGLYKPRVEVALNWPQTRARRVFLPQQTLCLPWGRGVGKSWYHRVLWYMQVAEWDGVPRLGRPNLRGVRINLLVPTVKQGIDIHGQLIEQELTGAGEWAFLGAQICKTPSYHVKFPGGSIIRFCGAHNADAFRGLRTDIISVDEGDDVSPSAFEAVATPWLSEPWSFGIRVVSGTPRMGRYGLLYQLYRLGKTKTPNFHTFHATYRDAPEQVSQQYVEQVRQTMAPATFAREWECDFDANEGLVYEMFREEFHVREPPRNTVWNEILIGVDHGYEDPAVFVVIGITGSGKDAVCWVIEEFYRTKQTLSDLEQVVRKLRVKYPRAIWYADPSRPDTIEEYKKRTGVRMLPAMNAIDDGVAAVADRLMVRSREDGTKYAKLYVSAACSNTIREFGCYRRCRGKDKDIILEQIEDANNHAMDGTRYAIFSRFGAPVVVRSTPQGYLV